MEYNTERNHLKIPEYGRNIQKMVRYIIEEEDKNYRTQLAYLTIEVMKQISPKMDNLDDFEHKLWDHLYIISDFKLDVDSPYALPKKPEDILPPIKTTYPNKNFKFRYYGKHIENIIDKLKDMPEGEAKDTYALIVANQMKRSYLNWNRESVSDDLILKHLEILSEGKLKVKDDARLINTYDVVNRAKKTKPGAKTNSGLNSRYKSNQKKQSVPQKKSRFSKPTNKTYSSSTSKPRAKRY